jgi:Stage II sporulation protein M
MQIVSKPREIVRANLRPYLAMNALVYGLCLVAFGLALAFPALTVAQVGSLEANGTLGLIRSLLNNVWLLAVVILAVNIATVGLLLILLPSMLVPFAGLALLAYKVFTLGLTLAPHDEAGWVALIPHSLTWLIEFQAYVLLALGAYILGRSWLRPRTVGAENRRQGYVRGLRQAGWLALPALALLIIGAIYEAFSLIYLVGPLIHLLVTT